MKWTKKQEEAINEKGEILVAAAAGSGKTSVLVERNIKKIINEKVDINKILSITFTTAAANEVKERILLSLYNELDKNEDDNIKRQIRLLPKANISTLHSFCFNLIKENFFNLNLSSEIVVGQSEEIDILKQEALEEALELEYEKNEESFFNLLNFYSSYRNDNILREEIIKIHEFLESIPFYEDWIEEALDKLSETDLDYAKTFYGSILFNEAKEIVKGNIDLLINERSNLSIDPNLIVFRDTISADIDQLEKLLNTSNWDELYNQLNYIEFERWPTKKGLVSDEKDRAYRNRNKVKDDIALLKDVYIREKSENIIEDNLGIINNIKTLFSLSQKLDKAYTELKQSKNLLDFADLEKYALKLLLEKRDGKYFRTEIAENISQKYVEIQVDEYQDINKMQDLIIWSISNDNVFRVGDLKQSIYRFRKANPDIFIEKYNMFKEKDAGEIKNETEKHMNSSLINHSNDGTDILNGSKILLYQNFRSRKNIINFCNDLFSIIMSEKLGEIEYDEKEYLNYSANYEDKDTTTEITLISKEGSTDTDDLDDETKELIENTENIQLEAYYIANRIKELFDSEFLVQDSSGSRKIEYRDIVILLRSAKDRADTIEKILYEKGIPVYTDSSSNFFESPEIATIISLLKIIDNPLLDIDFVSILKSFFGGFTLNEITKIRITNKNTSMYGSLREYYEKTKDKKTKNFLDFLTKLKEVEKYLGITSLLNLILIDSGYINYISLENNGEIKKANLSLFLSRAEEYEGLGNIGLFKFIQYLERLEINNTDIASANIIGEKENVVRIMTVHSSKGLEFPVVILANTNKRINLQDLRDNLLLSLNFGVAIDYLDYKRKIKYPTLIKEAIKIKMKEEIVAEEMRVLYVALTRAKEKLILTGAMKDANKYITDINNLAESYTERSTEKIKYTMSPYILKSKSSYLEWILLANNIGLSNSKPTILTADSLDFKEKDYKKEILKIDLSEFQDESIVAINKKLEMLDYKYDIKDLNYTKIAASRVHLSEENIIQENIKSIQMKKPKFMISDTFSKAEIGSFNHLFLQKLKFNKIYSKEELKVELNKIVKEGLLLEEQAKHIDIKAILNFVQTEEYKEIINSKQEKEKQFFSKFLMSEIKEIIDKDNIEIEEKDKEEEFVLIQGMIDLYYITEDNKLKILDYKTDNTDLNTLKDRYKTQMLIYKKALEKALKREVNQVLIYSTIHNKYIEI